MNGIDWRMISVFFSVFHFIFMAVVFSIIKFNDLRHLDDDVKCLSQQQRDYEKQQNIRHLENLDAIKDLSVQVAHLAGRDSAVQEIKKELNK